MVSPLLFTRGERGAASRAADRRCGRSHRRAERSSLTGSTRRPATARCGSLRARATPPSSSTRPPTASRSPPGSSSTSARPLRRSLRTWQPRPPRVPRPDAACSSDSVATSRSPAARPRAAGASASPTTTGAATCPARRSSIRDAAVSRPRASRSAAQATARRAVHHLIDPAAAGRPTDPGAPSASAPTRASTRTSPAPPRSCSAHDAPTGSKQPACRRGWSAARRQCPLHRRLAA